MICAQVPKAAQLKKWTKLAATLGLMLSLSGCVNAPSPLQPRGPAAMDLARLWWVLLSIATIVFVIVLALLGYGLFRSRRQPGDGGIGSGRLFVGVGGALIPALILVGAYAR